MWNVGAITKDYAYRLGDLVTLKAALEGTFCEVVRLRVYNVYSKAIVRQGVGSCIMRRQAIRGRPLA